MPAQPISVVIIEDDTHFRESVAEMLAQTPDIVCAGTYASLKDIYTDLAQVRPTVFWVDLNLPDGTGIELLRVIKQQQPEALCLVCSLHDDDAFVFDAIKAGADAYLLKNTSIEKMLAAIYELVAGGAPMSPYIARKVMASLRPVTVKKDTAMSELTHRELEVLEQVAGGFLYKEIADQLQISVETVKKHVRNIYGKLQVQNRTEAVLKFLSK